MTPKADKTSSSVVAKNIYLTPKEREVLMLISSGASRKEIARVLCIRHDSPQKYIESLNNKIDIPDWADRLSWLAVHANEILEKCCDCKECQRPRHGG